MCTQDVIGHFYLPIYVLFDVDAATHFLSLPIRKALLFTLVIGTVFVICTSHMNAATGMSKSIKIHHNNLVGYPVSSMYKIQIILIIRHKVYHDAELSCLVV